LLPVLITGLVPDAGLSIYQIKTGVHMGVSKININTHSNQTKYETLVVHASQP